MLDWLRYKLRKSRAKETLIPAYIRTVWKSRKDGRLYLNFRCAACGQRYRLYDIEDIDKQ